MNLFNQQKIDENKNLLLQRFQRAKNLKSKDNSFSNCTSDKPQKLDISFNETKKVYFRKKNYEIF